VLLSPLSDPLAASLPRRRSARDWTGYDSEAGWPWEGMDHGLRNHRRAEGSGDRRWGGGMQMMCRWDIGEREQALECVHARVRSCARTSRHACTRTNTPYATKRIR
jgi:hypothetical protein